MVTTESNFSQFNLIVHSKTMRLRNLYLLYFLLFVLALPWVRFWFEQSMQRHMLLQFPLLILIGIGFTSYVPDIIKQKISRWNKYGITGLILVSCIMTLLMIPLVLDIVLINSWAEAAKFIALLTLGMALQLSWRSAGFVIQGFFLGNILPMIALVGWCYVASPLRLCNAYLNSAQQSTGQWLIEMAILLSLCWLASFFINIKTDKIQS